MTPQEMLSMADRDAKAAYYRDQGLSTEEIASIFAVSAGRVAFMLERFDKKLARDVLHRVKQQL